MTLLAVSEDGNNATGTYTVQITITGNHGVLFPLEGTQGSVSEQTGQDLPDDRGTTTGRVQVSGDPATGNISTNGDTDGFLASLTGGHTYRIDVKGSEASDQGGTLGDLYVLFKGTGGFIPTSTNNLIDFLIGTYVTSAGAVDNNSGEGRNARIELEPLGSGEGTYYIRVSENGDNATGTYTVVVTRIE